MLGFSAIMAIAALSPLVTFIAYPWVMLLMVRQILKGKHTYFLELLHKDRELAFLMLACIMSVISSQWPMVSLSACAVLVIQVMAYAGVREMGLKDRVRLLDALLIAGGLVALLGIIQYFFVDINMPQRWLDERLYNPERYKRVFSTFFNPNVLAGYLILIISLSLSATGRKYSIAVLVLSLVCLFFTFSRGGWFGTAAAVVSIMLIKKDKRAMIALCVVCAALFWLFWPIILGRAKGLLEDSAFLYRIEIWRTALGIFLRYPVTGCGFGTAWKTIPLFSEEINALVGHAHNLYLNFAMETGLIGLAAFVLFIRSRLVKGVRVLQLKEDDHGLTVGIMGGLIGTLFHGLSDAVPIAPQLGIIIWIFLGLLDRQTDGLP